MSEQTSARLIAERTGFFSRPLPRWLRAVIFFAAYPVIVPSLVIHWVFAKRWGRVPYFSVVADGFVVLLLCLGNPFLFSAAAVAFACALLLVFRSAALGRADSGIFLGYSNAVVMPLILGGLVAAVGFGVGLPSGTFRKASLATTPMTNYRVAAALDSAVPIPKRVRFTDATASLAGAVGERGGQFAGALAGEPERTWFPVETTGGRVWIVLRGSATAPAPAAEGLFLRMPPDLEASLRSAQPDAFTQVTHGPQDVFIVLGDVALYEEFGVRDPLGETAWGWLAVGLVGLVLLVFATWRAVSEEEN